MKINSLVLSLQFMTLLCFSQEQESKQTTKPSLFGLKSGINVSSFSASVNSEPKSKIGLSLGFFLKKPLTNDKAFLRWEVYYSNQGQKDNYVAPPSGPSIGNTTTSIHYINSPLLFEYGRKLSLQAGVQLGLLIMGTEKGKYDGESVNNNLKDVVNKTDLGVVLGVGFSPIKKLSFGFRYNIGVTDIYKGDSGANLPFEYPSVSNRVLHFYIATSFK